MLFRSIEPFGACNQFVTLSTSKHGEQGRIQLNLLFQPAIIVKTRKNTSTFTSAGRTMTQLGSLPIAAGKGVLGVFKHKDKDHEHESLHDSIAAGKGVLHGIFKHKDHDHESLQDGRVSTSTALLSSPAPALQEAPVNNVLEPGLAAFPTKAYIDTPPGCNEPGMLQVVAASAVLSDDSKAYVVLRVGDKEVKTKHSAKTTHPEW